MHLLQSALVHVNTPLLQEIVSEPGWSEQMTDEDRRALSPLFWAHVNPYGRFVLNMDTRLDLAATGFPSGSPQPTQDAVPSGPI
ncbi:MAG: Tn3 family transposase [Rubrobacter sp.]